VNSFDKMAMPFEAFYFAL